MVGETEWSGRKGKRSGREEERKLPVMADLILMGVFGKGEGLFEEGKFAKLKSVNLRIEEKLHADA